MRNIIKISLATCLMIAFSGCAEKEFQNKKELEIKRHFSTSTSIHLNNDGSVSLTEEKGKLILPTCPEKIFAGGYSLLSTDNADDKDPTLDVIQKNYISNTGSLKDIYSGVNIENKSRYDSRFLVYSACVDGKSKNKNVNIYTEYVEANLVEKQ